MTKKELIEERDYLVASLGIANDDEIELLEKKIAELNKLMIRINDGSF